MKIIIVPNEPNPNMTGRHYGIAKALIAAGHEVHTVMWDLPQIMTRPQLLQHLFTSLRTRTYTYEDIRMHKFGRLPLFWPIINGWLFGSQLRRLYRDLNADIIFAMSYTNETTIPHELPYVYDLADDYAAPAEVFGSLAHKIMFKLLGVRTTMRRHVTQAQAVTAVSDILCAYARQYNTSVTKLPNGVEAKLIRALPKPSKVPPHSLIYVTGFGPWSQAHTLITIVVKLRKRYPDLTLTLVGEGSEVPSMLEFIKAKQAETYIHYKGFVHDRTEVFKLIQAHAIGLNISVKNKWRDAAHPMKVIEYSALGKKVVSTNLAGVEALDLPNIFMFDNSHKPNLRDALQAALIENSQSYPAISKRILREYSWENVIAQLTNVIDHALTMYSRPSIVHVTPSYPPTLGGLEKVVHVLAHTQAKAGHRVSVITSRSKVGENTKDNVVQTKYLSNFVIANTIVMPLLLINLLKIRKGQIVHLHITQAYTPEMVWIASLIKKYPYVAHIHLDVPPSGRLGVLLNTYKKLVLNMVLRGASHIIVPTADYKTLINDKYRIGLKNIVIIPNGTDHLVFDTPKKYPRNGIKLLFVGRLSQQKNIPLLIESLSCYLSQYSNNFHINIIGDGELRQSLLDLVSSSGLRKYVSFKGSYSGKKLENAYAESDIFVLSSIAESFGLVLVEAMTKGLPIVSTNIPAVGNIIQNYTNGLLVNEDPNEFARAIHSIASNSKLYENMSANNIESAHSYSWDMTNRLVMKLYREAI